MRLRLLELLDLGGVGEILGVDLYRCRLGARLRDLHQRVLFLLAGRLHGGDQIADQVGAALILGLNIGPFGFGRFLRSGDAVDAAGGQRKGGQQRQEESRGKSAQDRHGTSSALLRCRK